MSEITGPDATTFSRLTYLRHRNWRLRRFLYRAEFHGWAVEPSSVARDTVVVRHPDRNDHFVLYPRGLAGASALTVYDGRDGHEFSPLPTRDALSFISQNGARP